MPRGPGVSAVSPFTTDVAYVGTEIQDIFGIDVASLQRATSFSDSFFQSATASQTLARLAATPDGLLVSDTAWPGYELIPTGAMYRAVTLAALRAGVDGREPASEVARELANDPHGGDVVPAGS